MKAIILSLAFLLSAQASDAQWRRQIVVDRMTRRSGAVYSTKSSERSATLLIDCSPPANGRMSLSEDRGFSLAHTQRLVMETRVRVDQAPPRTVSWKIQSAHLAFAPTLQGKQTLVDVLKGATTLLIEVELTGGQHGVETFNVKGSHVCPP